LPFYRIFLPSEADKTLKTEDIKRSAFYPELPGIIKWAVEGAKRLLEADYNFSEAQAMTEQMENYEQNTSSVSAFTHENFDKFNDNDQEFFSVDRLYRIYAIWCKRNNKKPMASNNFREDLKRVMKQKPIIKWDKREARDYHGYNLALKKNTDIKTATDYVENISDAEDPQLTEPRLLKIDY
jgi:phage/plasmid-associated DNA primase